MNLIKKEYILLNINVKNKKELFKEFSKRATEVGLSSDSDKLYKGFLLREKESSTGMEDGFAIPHAKIPEINSAAIMIAKLKNKIKWKSFDGKKIKIAIALLIPEKEVNKLHIKILSSLAKKLLDQKFKDDLKNSNDKNKIVNLIKGGLNG